MFQIGEVTACSERVDWTPTLVFYNWLTPLFTTLLPSCPTSRTTAILIFPPERSCSTWGFTTHMRISVLFLVAAPLVLLFSTVSKSNMYLVLWGAPRTTKSAWATGAVPHSPQIYCICPQDGELCGHWDGLPFQLISHLIVRCYSSFVCFWSHWTRAKPETLVLTTF